MDCAIPSVSDGEASIYYNSTLEGSQLEYSIKCENKNILSLVAVCQKNATWFPDPSEYVCTSSTSETMPPKSVEHSKRL